MTYLYNKNVNPQNNNIVVSTSNPLPVTGNVAITGNVTTIDASQPSAVSAFGEPYGITITPVIQLDAIYGITDEVIQTYTSGTGSSAGGGMTTMFHASSGTSVGGYGVVRSARFMRYRPGQGALARFTAMFDQGVAGSSMRAGLTSQEQALCFGYDGTKFGILRANGGKAHIGILTINTAPTGTQSCNIVLNGVNTAVTVHSGNTINAAHEIANTPGGFPGWQAQQVDNAVVFLANTLGTKVSTFALNYISGTGTQIVGTFTNPQPGVAQTENWTYQEDWNIDCLGKANSTTSIMGPNPSGMNLNPQFLNVYQINFRWLGAGEIRYAVEDANTGSMIFVHREHYVNRHTTPHISNPSFKVGYSAFSTGATSNVTVRGASMMGAIEGDIRQNELNRSHSKSDTTLASGTLHHLFTIKNPLVTNGLAGALNGNYIVNAKELILKDISVAVQGNDPGVVYIFYNPTSFSDGYVWRSLPKNNAVYSNEVGTFDATIDTPVCQFVTAINGEAQYKLNEFRIAVPPGSQVSIAISSTSNMSRATAALVWSED
jgi:hypothetical protein